MVRPLLMACILLLGSLAPASAARARRKRRAAAKPAAGPVSRAPARAQRLPEEASAPKDGVRPAVSLPAEPEAMRVPTLTGRAAPDITQRPDLPSWARGWVPLPAEPPAPGPTEEERSAAGSARARSAAILLSLVLVGLGTVWVPDLLRAAGEGLPPRDAK